MVAVRLTAAGLFCGSCGTELPARTPSSVTSAVHRSHTATQSAEYKQVTVLFADVVHSMDIAAAVGTERLREIMTDLVNRAAVVVQRYGGTVGSFTGDGIMAVFGAPVGVGGSRYSCLSGGPGHPGRGEAACRRRPRPRRCRAAVADRLELGPSDRR